MVTQTCVLVLSRVWYLFFFFQAEDGIRDYKVTGVQTCALPILLAVLRDLGLEALVEEGLIEVMNKTDLLEPSARAALSNQVERRNTDTVALSAVTGEGCDRLLQLIDGRLDAGLRAVRLDVPLSDGRTLALIYAHGEVLGRPDDAEAAHLSVRLTEADLGRLRHRQRLH